MAGRTRHQAGRLTGLEKLDVTRTAITDKALVAIGKLANLKLLTLVGTCIGDADIAAPSMRRLR